MIFSSFYNASYIDDDLEVFAFKQTNFEVHSNSIPTHVHCNVKASFSLRHTAELRLN